MNVFFRWSHSKTVHPHSCACGSMAADSQTAVLERNQHTSLWEIWHSSGKHFFEIPRRYLTICGIYIGNRQITLPFLSIFFNFKTVDLTLRNTPAQSCVFSWQAACRVRWKKACKNLSLCSSQESEASVKM